MSQIPKNWKWTTIGNIAAITGGDPAPQGRQFFEDGIYPFVRVQDMGNLNTGIYIHETKDKLNEIAIKKMRLFPKGSILFTKSGMSLLLNQRGILSEDTYVVSHIGIAIPKYIILSEFLYYWLKTIDFKNLVHVTALPSVQLSKVMEIPIPLPPIEIQKKIVHKLNHIFIQLKEKEKEILILKNKKRLENLILHLNSSLLKSFFQGKITQRNHDDESVDNLLDKIKFKRKNVGEHNEDVNNTIEFELHEIPKEWKWVRMKEICDGMVPGRYKPAIFDGDIPWITLPDINSLYVSKSQKNIGVTKEEVKKVNMKIFPAKSVLISCVGELGIVSIADCPIVPNQQFHGFVCHDGVIPEYVAYALMSEKEQMEKNATRTTIAYMNKTKCNNIMIPLAPTEEQKRIIMKLKEKRNYINSINTHIESITRQETRLPNLLKKMKISILDQAFSGKLVN